MAYRRARVPDRLVFRVLADAVIPSRRASAEATDEIVTLGQVLHLLVVDPHQGPDLLAEQGTYDAEPLGDESGPGGQPDELIAGPDA